MLTTIAIVYLMGWAICVLTVLAVAIWEDGFYSAISDEALPEMISVLVFWPVILPAMGIRRITKKR